MRVVLTGRQLGPASEPTLRDLSEALIAVYGTDCGIYSPIWIFGFTEEGVIEDDAKAVKED